MTIPKATPATAYKEIWARAGVVLMITDEEAAVIFDHEVNSSVISQIMEKIISEGRFRWEGNSYIPARCITDYNSQYGTDFDDDGEPEWEL